MTVLAGLPVPIRMNCSHPGDPLNLNLVSSAASMTSLICAIFGLSNAKTNPSQPQLCFGLVLRESANVNIMQQNKVIYIRTDG